MNKLCAFICLVVVFTSSNHLLAQNTLTASADFTGTGVVIVDSSVATEFANVSDPGMNSIIDVFFTANLSSSSFLINSDGTIDNSGGSPFNRVGAHLNQSHWNKSCAYRHRHLWPRCQWRCV